MRHVISPDKWALSIDSILPLVKDGDEIVVPNFSAKRLTESILKNDHKGIVVTVILEEKEAQYA